jgi:hypothetical protein
MLWRDKKRGRVTSSGGGGDYAAQCFLGKLKRAGYVRHAESPGSSLWEITPAGRNALASALNASGAPGEVRQLLRTTNAGGRVVGPRELAQDIEAHDPIFVLDNGARVTFTVQEIDSGDGYGVHPNYHPKVRK